MRSTGMNKLTGLGAVSIATLCLAWSGLSSAGAFGPTDYTTVSKASVKIQSFEQTGEGETEKVTVKTNDVINYLLGEDPGTKVPKNLRLVLLNYCDDPSDHNALAVWDRDEDDLAEAGAVCLGTEGSAIYNDKKDTIYRPLDIDGNPFMMDEIDMDVQIKLGRVKSNLIEARPECLKRFSTMAMSGYYSNGDGAEGSRVMRKSGSIKTSGSVFEVLEGDVVGFICD